MKEEIALLFILLYFFQPALAQEEIPVIQARLIVSDNNVSVDSVQLVYGFPSESEQDANYIAKLMDEGLSTIYQTRFYLEEFVPTIPESLGEEGIDYYYETVSGTLEAVVFLPFFEDAAFLAIGKENEGLTAFIDLRERLCDMDGECSENENYLSCPEDCPLEKSDNYCFPESDGVCDPDCIEGLDEDCIEEKGKVVPEKPELDLSKYFLPATVVLIILVIISYNLLKRRPGKSKH